MVIGTPRVAEIHQNNEQDRRSSRTTTKVRNFPRPGPLFLAGDSAEEYLFPARCSAPRIQATLTSVLNIPAPLLRCATEKLFGALGTVVTRISFRACFRPPRRLWPAKKHFWVGQ